MHYETSWNVLLLFSGEIFGLSECGLGAEGVLELKETRRITTWQPEAWEY